ncbi:MAG TPA: response regulator transcription factor [Candidatus Methylomirabilis sp.]|nr:response regulator transcription factor [Candidatus Methylomirabilis sp.]
MRLLIVEDDRAILDFLRRGLSEAGYAVDVCTTGAKAMALAIEAAYDAVVIDLGLPDADGLDLIARLRERGVSVPFLILSARRSVDQRVLGLERGGDDYLTKPFAFAELLARLRALVRRAQPAAREPARLQVSDLEVDLIRRAARRGTRDLSLTPQEFSLLEYLCRNSGRVVTRTMILNDVWKLPFDPGTNVVDVHIHRLRGKVDRDSELPLIRTVRGVGYLLEDP